MATSWRSVKECNFGDASCATSKPGCVLPEYTGSYREPYGTDLTAASRSSASGKLLTTTSLIATRGCHNRCGFCYLATDGLRMPYQMRQRRSKSPASSLEDGQPYGGFHRQQPRLQTGRPAGAAAARSAPSNGFGAPRSPSTSPMIPSLIREMALAGCTGVFIGFEIARKREHHRSTQEKPAHRRLRQTSGGAPRQRHPGKREFRPGV